MKSTKITVISYASVPILTDCKICSEGARFSENTVIFRKLICGTEITPQSAVEI